MYYVECFTEILTACAFVLVFSLWLAQRLCAVVALKLLSYAQNDQDSDEVFIKNYPKYKVNFLRWTCPVISASVGMAGQEFTTTISKLCRVKRQRLATIACYRNDIMPMPDNALTTNYDAQKAIEEKLNPMYEKLMLALNSTTLFPRG